MEHRIEAGDPATEIVRVAQEESFDVLFVGSQSRGGVSRLILGSVTTSLLAKAPCEVVVCHRPSAADVGATALPK